MRALHVTGRAVDRHRLRALLRRAAPTARHPTRSAPTDRRQDRRRPRHRGHPGGGRSSLVALALELAPPRRPARRLRGRRRCCSWVRRAARASASRSPGRLRAEVNLAASNGLYLVLLLLSGIVVPVTSLPAFVQKVVVGAALGGAGRRTCIACSARACAPSGADWVVSRRLGGARAAARGAHVPLRLSDFARATRDPRPGGPSGDGPVGRRSTTTPFAFTKTV